ncbi:MAG: hypothetical protein ACYC1T_02750 [Sulfuricaulis sp.]
MKKTLLAISLFVAFTGFAAERGFAMSECDGYRGGLHVLIETVERSIKSSDNALYKRAREDFLELHQEAIAAGCLGNSGPAAVKRAQERALAECRWEVRQMEMSRQRPAFAGTGGFNDPQMGMAAANLAAIAASMPPGPAVMDECMAAKGF